MYYEKSDAYREEEEEEGKMDDLRILVQRQILKHAQFGTEPRIVHFYTL